MTPKYPEIEVELIGQDGNAFAILGNVMRAMRQAKVPNTEIDAFLLDGRTPREVVSEDPEAVVTLALSGLMQQGS